jgi:HAD superfamily hydrolase (TIGR01458 family)
MEDLKGFLIDLDGVTYSKGKPVPGSVETIHWLKNNRIPYKFVSNTSVMSRRSLVDNMKAMGFEVEEDQVITAAYAAARYVQSQGNVSAYLLAYDDVRNDFAGIALDSEKPDFVVIGSKDDGYGYESLRTAFKYLYDGAKFIAIHKNRTWMRPDGLTPGVGAYVRMLEYATPTEAIIIGKPEKQFFNQALEDLKLEPAQVAMIGDDLESDVQGAQNIGMKGIFCMSGKYTRSDCSRLNVKPDLIIDDLSDIRKIFKCSR